MQLGCGSGGGGDSMLRVLLEYCWRVCVHVCAAGTRAWWWAEGGKLGRWVVFCLLRLLRRAHVVLESVGIAVTPRTKGVPFAVGARNAKQLPLHHCKRHPSSSLPHPISPLAKSIFVRVVNNSSLTAWSTTSARELLDFLSADFPRQPIFLDHPWVYQHGKV